MAQSRSPKSYWIRPSCLRSQLLVRSIRQKWYISYFGASSSPLSTAETKASRINGRTDRQADRRAKLWLRIFPLARVIKLTLEIIEVLEATDNRTFQSKRRVIDWLWILTTTTTWQATLGKKLNSSETSLPLIHHPRRRKEADRREGRKEDIQNYRRRTHFHTTNIFQDLATAHYVDNYGHACRMTRIKTRLKTGSFRRLAALFHRFIEYSLSL